jgi:hypothetical protein
MAAKSDQYSYERCARAQIFARDAPNVHTLADMQRLMQSNDYKNDPLSLGSPANAISSRYDLVDSQDAFPVGGIDSKITSSSLFRSNTCYAISGPTHQSLPAFEWAGPWAEFPHLGMPEMFAYDYTVIEF